MLVGGETDLELSLKAGEVVRLYFTSTLMIGTLQLARALIDRDMSDQLLARGVETALRLLDNVAR